VNYSSLVTCNLPFQPNSQPQIWRLSHWHWALNKFTYLLTTYLLLLWSIWCVFAVAKLSCFFLRSVVLYLWGNNVHKYICMCVFYSKIPQCVTMTNMWKVCQCDKSPVTVFAIITCRCILLISALSWKYSVTECAISTGDCCATFSFKALSTLPQKSETVAENGENGDSHTFLRQCGQGLRASVCKLCICACG